jgi:tripartite-type tricarboxylate transporter receptor subunit TctC
VARGGSTDQVMRALAQATEKYLGQPIIIENKAGAGGTLGAVALTTAKPDGYTVTQLPITIFRLPHTTKTGFDPLADFTYIIGVSGYTFGVVVRADAPYKTWQELIDYAKANPGKLSYGTPGANTSLHVTMEEIGYRYGISGPTSRIAATPTTCRGSSAATSTSRPTRPAGARTSTRQVALLATWGEKRTKRWPNVPTLKELGYDIVSTSPYGIGGPKGMDPQVVRTLHDAFKKGMEDPVHMQAMEKYDQDLIYMSGDDYAKFARKAFEDERRSRRDWRPPRRRQRRPRRRNSRRASMDRRDTILALFALGAAPLTAKAQQTAKVARIGYLSPNLAANPPPSRGLPPGIATTSDTSKAAASSSSFAMPRGTATGSPRMRPSWWRSRSM